MKIDVNDKLFSKLKRMNQVQCQRCCKELSLQCCHIFSRRFYTTRFDTLNAVVLCYSCHSWMDTHKIDACLFNKQKRIFGPKEESYHFLVYTLGYTWEDLVGLYHRAQTPYRGYKTKKKDITKFLKKQIEEAE